MSLWWKTQALPPSRHLRWIPSDADRKAMFPDLEPGLRPFGSRVLVQIKAPFFATKGGILLTENDRETKRDNTQIAMVRSLGDLSFRDRKSLNNWPEGQWCQPGDVVLVPRFGQFERWHVPLKSGEKTDHIEFRLYDDTSILGFLTVDPSALKTNWEG
jgi:co-chaperonin GroES (HSP10)